MTTDHRTVGRLFMATSLIFGVGVALVGVLIGLERSVSSGPADIFGGLNAYFTMWTLYRMAFVLLVVMPLLMGMAMLVVPRQVGAANLAFPRAALASYWSWLIGSVIVVSSVFAGGGWGALDGVTGSERDAMTLTVLGTGWVIVSLLAGAVNVATTVVSLRAVGMTLAKIPLFCWSMLVTATVWLFTLPIAVANLVIIYADLRGGPPGAFGAAEGPDIWLQLDWLVEQPAVFAMAVPVLGIVGEIVSAATKNPLSRYTVVLTLVGLFGLLAIGGWSQDYFTTPGDHRYRLVYVAAGIATALVVLAFYGAVADTLRRGFHNLIGVPSAALTGSVVALVLLGVGVGAGALRVISLTRDDTRWDEMTTFGLLERSTGIGVFNAVVVAALAGAAAGVWHWAPEILGRPLGENDGRRVAVVVLTAGLTLAGPDAVAGFFGAVDGPVPGGDTSGVLTTISMVGSIVLVLGLADAAAAAGRALRSGSAAGRAEPNLVRTGSGEPT